MGFASSILITIILQEILLKKNKQTNKQKPATDQQVISS